MGENKLASDVKAICDYYKLTPSQLANLTKRDIKLFSDVMENDLKEKEKEPIQHINDVYNQAIEQPFNITNWKKKGVAVEYTGIPFQSMGLMAGIIGEKKPFIGQTVHYYDHYHHQRAAIVTAIHRESDEVDLFVLYPTRQDSIQHVKHDSDHEKETWDFIC